MDRKKGGNPFDADSSKGVASANPFDSDEAHPSSKNPFDGGGNPFGSDAQSTNPFDDPAASKREDGGTNPFDSRPKAAMTPSESKMKLGDVAKSPPRATANPFEEDSKPDLHMVPPREARSSITSLPPFVEGEVSCIILAECTAYQVMKNPKDHAVYTLTITATLSMKNAIPFSWSVKRRNKQFEALHANLSQHLDVSNLPPLPKKSWVRSLEPAYLESRRQAFDRYIQAVIQYYGEDPIVCTWLCDSFHKILLPFLHKQMEDRVTTDQLRHHLSAAVAREHALEQEIARHAEKEKAQEKAALQLQHAKLAMEEKCRALERAASEADSACADAKVQMQAWKSEYEKRQQQILVLQDELEQAQKKLKEREKLPPLPTSHPAEARKAPPPPDQPAERKSSVTNPFDEPHTLSHEPTTANNNNNTAATATATASTSTAASTATAAAAANLVTPASGIFPAGALLDSAALIECLSKPLFEPPQAQWVCSTCQAENKLPVVQCVQCRAVKALSISVELTITNIHKVQRSPKEEPFAEYLLQVKLGSFGYLVRRRFSDFERLHDSLVTFFGRMDSMPSLPKTSMFGGGNSFDPAFLQQRRTQLQAFLHGLVKHSLFFHCGPLCGWLVLDSVDGMFGPLIRATSTQNTIANQLAEHVKELESTVGAKTQLLVEALELRNRLEEALETEKEKGTKLHAEGELLLAQMQAQQSQNDAETTRLKASIEEQSKSAAAARTALELELSRAKKDIERLAQEAASLMLSLADADRNLQGEKAAKAALEQQLSSALTQSAQMARELDAAQTRAKVASAPAIEGMGTPPGGEFCVVSPPLSPSQPLPEPAIPLNLPPPEPTSDSPAEPQAGAEQAVIPEPATPIDPPDTPIDRPDTAIQPQEPAIDTIDPDIHRPEPAIDTTTHSPATPGDPNIHPLEPATDTPIDPTAHPEAAIDSTIPIAEVAEPPAAEPSNLDPSADPQAAPSDAVPSDAVPSGAVPSNAVPSDAVPSDAVPSDAVPSDAVPSGAVISEAVPSEEAEAARSDAVPEAALPGGSGQSSESAIASERLVSELPEQNPGEEVAPPTNEQTQEAAIHLPQAGSTNPFDDF